MNKAPHFVRIAYFLGHVPVGFNLFAVKILDMQVYVGCMLSETSPLVYEPALQEDK